jgi:hypothetical protein
MFLIYYPVTDMKCHNLSCKTVHMLSCFNYSIDSLSVDTFEIGLVKYILTYNIYKMQGVNIQYKGLNFILKLYKSP